MCSEIDARIDARRMWQHEPRQSDFAMPLAGLLVVHWWPCVIWGTEAWLVGVKTMHCGTGMADLGMVSRQSKNRFDSIGTCCACFSAKATLSLSPPHLAITHSAGPCPDGMPQPPAGSRRDVGGVAHLLIRPVFRFSSIFSPESSPKPARRGPCPTQPSLKQCLRAPGECLNSRRCTGRSTGGNSHGFVLRNRRSNRRASNVAA